MKHRLAATVLSLIAGGLATAALAAPNYSVTDHLKGAGDGNPARRQLLLANANAQQQQAQVLTQASQTVTSVSNAYWDLVASRAYLRVAEQAVASAQQQDDEDRQRVRVGVMAPIDVLSADAQQASTRAQLVTAQTQAEQQQLIVKTYMSRMSDPALDAAAIEPTDPLPDPADVDLPPLSRSIVTALASRSSIRQAELSLENQRIAEQYTRKNLLPTFSVYAAVDLYGLAPGTDPAVRQLVQWAFPEYSAGFTWSLPLFNRAAQADDVRARLSIQETEAALQRTRSQIATQVQTATVSVTRDRAQVQAAERAVSVSRQVFEAEQKKLRYVISTPYRASTPARSSSSETLSAVWPPMVGNRASGRSLAMICSTMAAVIGST